MYKRQVQTQRCQAGQRIVTTKPLLISTSMEQKNDSSSSVDDDNSSTVEEPGVSLDLDSSSHLPLNLPLPSNNPATPVALASEVDLDVDSEPDPLKDQLTPEEQLRVSRAAVYIDFSLSLKGKIADVSDRPYAVTIHWLLHNTTILRQILMYSLLFLAFFEIPSWCFGFDGDCGDPEIIIQSGIPRIPVKIGLVVEFFLVLDLAVFHFLKLWTITFNTWWSDPSQVISGVFFVISIIDICFSFVFPRYWRLSPFFRPFIFVNMMVSVKKAFYGIFHGILEIASVIFLEFVWIFFMSWIGLVLFQDIGTSEYFKTLPQTMMDLFILLTTSNFPDVAIPALQVNLVNMLFFCIFLFVGLWVLMNLVLATIYTRYRKQLEDEKKEYIQKQEYCLTRAFKEMDGIRNSGTLNIREIFGLFRELNMYLHIPYINKNQAKLLFISLDIAKNGTIFESEFLRILDVLDLNFTIHTTIRQSFLERMAPEITNSETYKIFCKIIRHDYFDFLIDAMIGVNFILTAIEFFGVYPNTIFWKNYDSILTFVCLNEMILKIFAEGGIKEYLSKEKNRFDALIILFSVLVETTVLINVYFDKKTLTRVILMFRIGRLLRLLLRFKNYQILASTFFTILPTFLQLTGVLFTIFYSYSLVGILIFGGKIYTDAPYLNGTLFQTANYSVLNFNDFPSGMVTLFALLIVSNWQEIMRGFVNATAEGAQIFFISFWILAVVITLSVVVAAVLDRFVIEVAKKKQNKRDFDVIDPVLLAGIQGLGRSISEEGVNVTVTKRVKNNLFDEN